MFKGLIFFLIHVQVFAYAQNSEFFYNYEGYAFAESQRGYNNSISYEATLNLDQRAELKWVYSDAKFIFRPRLIAYADNKQSSTYEVNFNITDAFYEKYISDHVFTTVGLQVYQWGPAESINPSNPFFHFNSNQRSLIYKEKGKVLLRLNLNLESQDNFVLIVEPISNNETYWIAEKKFKPQIAGKFDISWPGTRNFLGIVLGIPDNADFFIAEYFQYEFKEGLSVYADAKHSVNTFSYQPKSEGIFFQMQPMNQTDYMSTLSVVGLRYEDEFDARLEYVYNSAGYEKKKFKNALVAISQVSPYLVENLARFQASGLELLGQNYLYFSIRKTDPFKIKDFSIYFRSMTSLMDHSGVEQFEFDKSVLDWMNVFGQYSAFRGSKDTEFKLSDNWKASLGVKAIY